MLVYLLSVMLILRAIPEDIDIGETATEQLGVILMEYNPGDTLSRIELQEGWTATVYCTGLSGADGLAMSHSRMLYVAEETAHRISTVDSSGVVTPFATGISYPEGIDFNSNGILYVSEDVESGSLYAVDSAGVCTEILSGLIGSEGVAVEEDDNILVTESTVEFVSSPWDYRTNVTRILPDGTEEELQYSQYLWSYSGITTDSAGTVYVCNEASGTGTYNSVFKINPSTGTRTLFVDGLVACEGLRFSPGGRFPLYVVEEDTGSGNGKLTSVNSDGIYETFASGFYNIEDVLVDDSGRIFVSEDGSGMIILLEMTTEVHSPETSISPEVLSVEVFPNPFAEYLQVSLHIDEDMQFDISMYDIAGREVFCNSAEELTSSGRLYFLDTDDLNNGVYYLCISSTLGVFTANCLRRQR